MFLIELTYKAALAEIDRHMKAHVAFLNRHYAAGRFVVSGRKIPREGGIIVAIGGTRGEIEALVREDPFLARGLAEGGGVEVRPGQPAPHLPPRVARGVGAPSAA